MAAEHSPVGAALLLPDLVACKRVATIRPEGTECPGHTTVEAFAGEAGYVVACTLSAVVLMVSGFAYYVKDQVAFIGGSDVISGGPETGAMNILLMGLESRTDYDGNILPANLLKALHAGSVQGVENGVGGQDTNTLILIHIFAGGQKAVGFSIPRDDWVTFPKTYDGQSQGKIDQAYGLAWAQSLSQTANSGMSHNQRYLVANEAGQAATIATVEQLTGVHVDHFAEVNLAGFYQLAQTFGGIEACLVPWNGGQNLHDANSGFSQSHAGYVFLTPAQALAFVRERDNLPNGDIDRTHRQQAVIDYVVWKLKHDGMFSDIGQLTGLLDVAKKYVITDSGWQILTFASEMRSLTGKNLTFQTAPVISTAGHEGGQTVNLIDPAAIKKDVQSTFYPPTSAPQPTASKSTATSLPASATTVDVYNGGGTPGLRRPAVPGADVGWLQGGQGRQHREPVVHPGAVRHGSGGERGEDRRVFRRRDRRSGRSGGSRSRGGPAGHGRHRGARRHRLRRLVRFPGQFPVQFPVRQSHTGVEQRPGGGVRGTRSTAFPACTNAEPGPSRVLRSSLIRRSRKACSG